MRLYVAMIYNDHCKNKMECSGGVYPRLIRIAIDLLAGINPAATISNQQT